MGQAVKGAWVWIIIIFSAGGTGAKRGEKKNVY